MEIPGNFRLNQQTNPAKFRSNRQAIGKCKSGWFLGQRVSVSAPAVRGMEFTSTVRALTGHVTGHQSTFHIAIWSDCRLGWNVT
jgi:hypothetical protein